MHTHTHTRATTYPSSKRIHATNAECAYRRFLLLNLRSHLHGAAKVSRAFRRTHVETPGRADLFNESINAGYAIQCRVSFAALSTAYHRDKLDGRTPLISFTLRENIPRLYLLAVSSGSVLPSGGYLNPRDKHGNYTRGLRTELI